MNKTKQKVEKVVKVVKVKSVEKFDPKKLVGKEVIIKNATGNYLFIGEHVDNRFVKLSKDPSPWKIVSVANNRYAIMSLPEESDLIWYLEAFSGSTDLLLKDFDKEHAQELIKSDT